MPQLVLVKGPGTDVIIRYSGRNGNEFRVVEDSTGDLALVVGGILRPYRFEPDIPFAEKHQLMMLLEDGDYKSFKTKGNVIFVCRNLQDATIRWNSSHLLHVYIVAGNAPLAGLRPNGFGQIVFTESPRATGYPMGTKFSEAFIACLNVIAKRHQI